MKCCPMFAAALACTLQLQHAQRCNKSQADSCLEDTRYSLYSMMKSHPQAHILPRRTVTEWVLMRGPCTRRREIEGREGHHI